MGAEIVVEHGTPRIRGTRASVYDIYYYLHEAQWPILAIALALDLFEDEVKLAIAYISSHQEEVEAAYRQIEKRVKDGNPPEIEAKARISREKMLQWRREHQPT